jgi:hypothetical protein
LSCIDDQREEVSGMTALKQFFGVVAKPQTWLDYAYLWLAFPLGLFYFVFLIVGLTVGLSLVIIWVGIPMLLLVAAAWYLFAGLERILARELLRIPISPSPRAWETVDGVWAKLKAHFGLASTWKDLVYLLARLPLGIVSFVLVMTQAGIGVAFIGAPLFQRFDALWLGGQRIDSPAAAAALVPLGVLLVIALFHVVRGWAWLSGRLAQALLGDGSLPPAPPRSGAWQQPGWQQMQAGPPTQPGYGQPLPSQQPHSASTIPPSPTMPPEQGAPGDRAKPEPDTPTDSQ